MTFGECRSSSIFEVAFYVNLLEVHFEIEIRM